MCTQKITVRRLAEEDQPLLEEMYDRFIPHGMAMGLPPRDATRRRDWLAGLRKGLNLVALVDGVLAGHLALMPDAGRAEMAVFVREDCRRQGVGTALTRQAVEEGREAGLDALWVLIEASNIPAWQGLKKFGFHAKWQDLHEAEMVFPLQREAKAA